LGLEVSGQRQQLAEFDRGEVDFLEEVTSEERHS
jgi:hypothetical protein